MAETRTALRPLPDPERPPPGRTSRSAGAERRELMLREAARLFGSQGYHATSVRQIAEATGLLPGSLYTHIRGKEQLLYEIVLKAAHAFHGALEEALAVTGPPEERFRRALRAHVEVITEHQDAARVFHHEWRALNETRRAEIGRLRDGYERRWDQLLAEVAGVSDPKLPRLLVLSAANWIYTWYEPGGELAPAMIADRFADLLLGGLRGARSGKDARRRGEERAR